MVRLSDLLGSDSGSRIPGSEEKSSVESFPEVVILTTDQAIVDLVREAIEDRGYRIRHFQSAVELRERLKAAGRVIVVVDGRLKGAAEFHRELSAIGYSNQLIIAPDETHARGFRDQPGVTVQTQPVGPEDLLSSIQEFASRPEDMPKPAVEGGLFSSLTRPTTDSQPADPPPKAVDEHPKADAGADASALGEQLGIVPEGSPVSLSDLAPPRPMATEEEASEKRETPEKRETTEKKGAPEESEKPETRVFPGASLITPTPSTEVPTPVEAPVRTDAGGNGSMEKELYESAVDVIFRFLSGHRSRSNPPLNEVAGITEKVVAVLKESCGICLQIIRHVPEFGDADRYLAHHHVNVMLLAAKAGMGKELPPKELYEVTLAAAVHDVGMTQLPEGLITRHGKLDQSGYSQIRQHSSYGKQQLQAYAGAYPWLLDVVYQEHERYDGSGYPEGLTGKDIHLYAQIIGLVDTYEALTHLRPYRDQMIPFNVLQQLIRLGGQLFSNDVVKAFIEEVSVFPIGSFVRLNSGEICEVTQVNRGYPLRPIVQVLYAADGSPLQQGREIDLKAEPMIYVTGPEDTRGLQKG